MKSKHRREAALRVIQQMKRGQLYTSKELGREAKMPTSKTKRLTAAEMAGFLREQKRFGVVEWVRMENKGFWRKIKRARELKKGGER